MRSGELAPALRDVRSGVLSAAGGSRDAKSGAGSREDASPFALLCGCLGGLLGVRPGSMTIRAA